MLLSPKGRSRERCSDGTSASLLLLFTAIGEHLLRVSTPPTTHTILSYDTYYVYPSLLEPYDHRLPSNARAECLWSSSSPTNPSVAAMGVMWRGQSWDIPTIILITIINPIAFYDL